MSRIATTLATILDRVVARLRDDIDDCGAANCYVSADPDSLPASNPAEFIYVVSPGPTGRFPEGYFDGGAANQAVVETVIVVTVHCVSQNDEPGRDHEFFTNQQRGVIAKGNLVIKSLGGHDLVDELDNNILAQPFFPADYALERRKRERGSMQLGFTCIFDWSFA